ncbi:protein STRICTOSIDINE SYNTHASE-LIKE 12-like [Abrus precatorius]|uniref:Protein STRICTOSIDINE SYNTHASE-LIKE 12-like n=1 Tax=Abrus precatorius TaxID=3816 RepID=A0A8B8MJ99_ABRPR|nr:protein STRICTOSIDINE SYNTHASE-LIKE 12-like [Abrus precatorius]
MNVSRWVLLCGVLYHEIVTVTGLGLGSFTFPLIVYNIILHAYVASMPINIIIQSSYIFRVLHQTLLAIMSKISMTMNAMFATLMMFLLCYPSVAILINRLKLPSPLTGPESIAFDRNGGGPYVGVSDGRILKYAGPNQGFQEYAYTSPNRNKTICDGLADFSTLQASCGRPLGLRFNHQTGELYAADAYFGILKIGPNGGPPTQCIQYTLPPPPPPPFKFLDGLDVDVNTGVVYFTEASANYQIKDFPELVRRRDSSGSLFSFDPSTNQTKALMRGLAFPSGVAVSRDGSFVLVSEFLTNRIHRFWLRGPKANSSEIFSQLTGSPDNIRRNPNGQFWVAMNSFIGPPPPPRPTTVPSGLRINENGIVLQIVSLAQEFGSDQVSEVHEFNGTLYCGSLRASYVTISTIF